MINTCKLNPCCGNMRDCNPPYQSTPSKPVAVQATNDFAIRDAVWLDGLAFRRSGDEADRLRAIAHRIRSGLSTSPAAEPVGWETEAEWDLETRVFNAANNRDVPEWARKVVADVWKQYCLAANPAPSASREVTDEMVERAAQELLAHGEFSSIPWRNHDNALKAARAALLAALPEREG